MSDIEYNPANDYKVGRALTLFPYEPVHPHGSGQYSRNPLPPDLPRGRVRDFDTTADYSKELAKIRIEEQIAVGWNRDFQIVSCSVTKFPENESRKEQQESLSHDSADGIRRKITRKLVLRFSDPKYRVSDAMAPTSNEEQADGDFSRDYWAMRHLHERNATGVGCLGPHFYGGWVAKIENGQDQGRITYRYVCVSIVEKVYGYTVDSLCCRAGEDEDGYLIPPSHPVPFPKADGTYRYVTFNRENCDEVIKLALHGAVVSMHHGVEHRGFDPESAFITFRDGDKDLPSMRVLQLGHVRTQAWRFTEAAAKEGLRHCFESLPYPPHPAEKFCHEALDDWWGFIREEEEFNAWLTSKKSFGPLQEARDVIAELGHWPHQYARYSTFATLDQIENDGVKKMVIAPRVAGYLYEMDGFQALLAMCENDKILTLKSRQKWITMIRQKMKYEHRKNKLILKTVRTLRTDFPESEEKAKRHSMLDFIVAQDRPGSQPGPRSPHKEPDFASLAETDVGIAETDVDIGMPALSLRESREKARKASRLAHRSIESSSSSRSPRHLDAEFSSSDLRDERTEVEVAGKRGTPSRDRPPRRPLQPQILVQDSPERGRAHATDDASQSAKAEHSSLLDDGEDIYDS